jgi:tetratricopeptide (TPR) repeat protein
VAIKGSLREASLPDVLQLLALGQKTGCLSITDRTSFGYVYFDKGRISYASIVNRRDRLGDILVKNGMISQGELDAAVAVQARQRDKRLGQILVERGAITRETLHHHVQIQIEEAVYSLFTWTQGTFSFEADVHPDEQPIRVCINPESLLLEGARRVDEWSQIEKKIAGFDLIFEVDRGRLAEHEPGLATEERRVVPLIDGRRDVHALVEESGLGEFEVAKALYGLLTAGFLQRVGRSRAPEDAAKRAKVDEHRNLGVAFYKAGMTEEAAREFRRVAELHPDELHARFYLALVTARAGQYIDAVSMLREATALPDAKVAVFHNLAYALECIWRYDEAAGALADAIKRGGADDPHVLTSIGIVALKQGDIVRAEQSLAAARPHWGNRPPSAAWYHYAALVAAAGGDLERALTIGNEGAAAHPRSAPLHNLLATVHERRGDFTAACAAAHRGLAEDPNIPQLQKNLGDCHYRAGQYDEAVAAYERALRLDQKLGGDVYFKLGNIHYKRGDKTEAIGCWERALALDPANDLVRSNLDLVKTVLA